MKVSNTVNSNGFLRRMGTAAVLFFLAKGLLWIAAPFLFMYAF